MLTRSTKRISMRALMVDDELGTTGAAGRAARSLVQELQTRSIEVVEATSAEDGISAASADSAFHVMLVDWSLGDDDENHSGARGFLQFIRSRNDKIPIFLCAERGAASTIPIEVMEMVDAVGWLLAFHFDDDAAGHLGNESAIRARRNG